MLQSRQQVDLPGLLSIRDPNQQTCAELAIQCDGLRICDPAEIGLCAVRRVETRSQLSVFTVAMPWKRTEQCVHARERTLYTRGKITPQGNVVEYREKYYHVLLCFHVVNRYIPLCSPDFVRLPNTSRKLR